MRLTNEVKDILKQRIREIFKEKLKERTKNLHEEDYFQELFLKELNKKLQTNLKNQLDAFEKKHNISFSKKDSIINGIRVRCDYSVSFKNNESDKYREISDNLYEKKDLAYQELILNLTFNKEIKTIEDALEKVKNSL